MNLPRKLSSAGYIHVLLPVSLMASLGVMSSISLARYPATLTTAPSAHLHFRAAERKARQLSSGQKTVGFALYGPQGKLYAAYNSHQHNSSGSITKAMLLVAFLRQIQAHGLSPLAQSKLRAMIQNSDNDAANWVYNRLEKPRVQINRVAANAGMTDFYLVVHPGDPYIIGESAISASDFARLFRQINTLLPARHRAFGLRLLSHLSAEDQKGLLQAGLPGTVYSKEGWTPLDSGYPGYPYIVNQAAQFTYQGNTYGIAVTVGRLGSGNFTQNENTGEYIIKSITKTLLGN